MRKLFVCFALAALATMTSLQAGEQKAQTQGACCAQTTTACCSGSKTASQSGACSAAAKVAKRNADVKGAVLLVQR